MPGINEHEVGRCSNCGGAVVLPESFMSVRKPVPTCERCGAQAIPRGPVIPMGKPSKGYQRSDEQ